MHSEPVESSAMRTPRPTTRSAHAFPHFIETDLYAAVPGLVLLSGCDPADPLIACEWRNGRPHIRDNRVGLDRSAEVCRHAVYCTGGDRLSGHSSESGVETH